jgi:hypothetical protein
MADERGWRLTIYFNAEATAGFVLVDREVRGVHPADRAWQERHASSTRLADAMRAMRDQPDVIISTRFLIDGTKPEDDSWSRGDAESHFLKIVEMLTAKGAQVRINRQAAKLIAERGV